MIHELVLLAYAVPALEPWLENKKNLRQSSAVCATMFSELIRFVRETASEINRRKDTAALPQGWNRLPQRELTALEAELKALVTSLLPEDEWTALGRVFDRVVSATDDADGALDEQDGGTSQGRVVTRECALSIQWLPQYGCAVVLARPTTFMGPIHIEGSMHAARCDATPRERISAFDLFGNDELDFSAERDVTAQVAFPQAWSSAGSRRRPTAECGTPDAVVPSSASWHATAHRWSRIKHVTSAKFANLSGCQATVMKELEISETLVRGARKSCPAKHFYKSPLFVSNVVSAVLRDAPEGDDDSFDFDPPEVDDAPAAVIPAKLERQMFQGMMDAEHL